MRGELVAGVNFSWFQGSPGRAKAASLPYRTVVAKPNTVQLRLVLPTSNCHPERSATKMLSTTQLHGRGARDPGNISGLNAIFREFYLDLSALLSVKFFSSREEFLS